MIRGVARTGLLIGGAAFALAACSPRGSLDFKPEAAGIGAVQDILVASNRSPDAGPGFLSRERSRTVRYFDFKVSVPPERAPGTVVFPNGADPDPTKHFLTVAGERLTSQTDFLAEVNRRLGALPRRNREVIVSVHGFNTTFAEGLYRQAQMSHDFGSSSVSVHYAWPSAASVTQYVTDRETSLFVRDGLEEVLDGLSRSQANRIVLTAHSMGAHVLLETLRQMDIRGESTLFDKLASVVLFAPDVDIDLFQTQATALARYDVPIFVFSSGSDRALWASSRLRGGATRLGSLTDASVLGEVPVFLVDLSELKDGGDALAHSKAANSPTMISIVDGMGTAGLEMFRQEERRPTLLEAGVIAVQGAGDAVSAAAGTR